MISRLSTFAAVFAVLATASLSYATSAHHASSTPTAAAAKQVRVVQLERVVMVGKRSAATAAPAI